MFLIDFYKAVLPDRVERECKQQPGRVPVVQFRLADGTTLDVCHIAHLADTWLGVAAYRDAATCEDMDFAFLPYEAVTRVTLSLHDPSARRLGFDTAKSARATGSTAEED